MKQNSFCGRIKVSQEGASHLNYSQEYKEALLRQRLPPNNESITKIAKEEGLSEQTLRNWQDKAKKERYAAPDNWSILDKFLIIVETASINETELGEYARKRLVR